MTEVKKVTARPPLLSAKDKEMAFINDGILETDAREGEADNFPWENSNVREDVIKIFNVRINEPYFLKLQYISKNILKKSTNAICVSLIEEFINRELNGRL
jgi:hypothetical protein